MSRIEDILKSIVDEKKYESIPQSRIEELLIELGIKIDEAGADPETIKEAVVTYLQQHPEIVSPYDDTGVRTDIAELKKIVVVAGTDEFNQYLKSDRG